MGLTEDRMRMIASQPHKFSAAGETLYVNISEPKIEKLLVNFSPVQTGSGTQSPTNVRPIMGYATIMASIGTKPVDISLGGTYYGGTVDLVSGVMTVTHEVWAYTSSATVSLSTKNEFKIIWITLGTRYATYSATNYHVFGDQYVTGVNVLNYTNPPVYSVSTTSNNPNQVFLKVYATDLQTQDVAGAKAFLASTAPRFYVPLATPETIQLTPQTLTALRGQQTVTSPAGDVEISYWAHDDRVNGVPSAYRIVKYIQSTQSAYIATEYIPTVGDAFEVDFSADSISDYNALYSAGTGDRQTTVLNGQYGQDRRYYCKHFASGAAATITSTGTLGTRYRMSVSASGVFTFDGQTATTTPEGELDGTATNLWVFRRRNDTQQFTGKLYGFRITNGTTTKLNLVPCVRKTDNVAGAYDTVTRTFYASAGSESFTAG